MVMVDHEVARLEILEEPGGLALAGAGGAVGATPPGEVGLGDDRQLRLVEHRAHVQRRDDDAPAGPGEGGGVRLAALDDREVETVLGQETGEVRRRALTVGGHDHAETVGEQLADAHDDPAAIAERGGPAGGIDGGRLGAVGRVEHLPGGGRYRCEQAVGIEVQAGERVVVGPPGLGERAGEVILLGEQVGGPVAEPARLDEQHLGVGWQQVGEQPRRLRRVRREPRQPALHAVEERALGETLPVLAAPRLGPDERGGTGAHLGGGQQLAGGEEPHLGEVGGGALVGDGELGQPVDLVAPAVDAHRRLGGGREDVEDRAAQCDFAAVLDKLFTPVPLVDERREQLGRVDSLTRPHHHGLGVLDVRAEALQRTAHREHDDLGECVPTDAQSPERGEALAHRLDRRAHALERQRLPGRHEHQIVGRDERRKVVHQLLRRGARRRDDREWSPCRQVREGGERGRPGRLRHGDGGVRAAEHRRERRVVAQQARQRRERGAHRGGGGDGVRGGGGR